MAGASSLLPGDIIEGALPAGLFDDDTTCADIAAGAAAAAAAKAAASSALTRGNKMVASPKRSGPQSKRAGPDPMVFKRAGPDPMVFPPSFMGVGPSLRVPQTPVPGQPPRVPHTPGSTLQGQDLASKLDAASKNLKALGKGRGKGNASEAGNKKVAGDTYDKGEEGTGGNASNGAEGTGGNVSKAEEVAASKAGTKGTGKGGGKKQSKQAMYTNSVRRFELTVRRQSLYRSI